MRQFLLFTAFILLSSCASQKLKIKKEFDSWEDITPASNVKFSLYLIGDAGLSYNGEMAPSLKYLKTKLDQESENSAVIFLGDNIYPDGLPEKEDENRAEAEAALMAQIASVRDFKGDPFFVPGNHDWEEGVDGIRRQEDFIEDELDKKKVFRPSDACSGPEDYEIGDYATIVFIDSQWWMENWDKHPKINGKCESKTRDNFIFNLRDLLKKNKEKTVILAMHHPVMSYGPHGGRYSADKQIFPLRWFNKNLFVPIPILGTFIRKYAGIPQDLNHPPYKEFIHSIKSSTADYPNLIFAGGHEHTQQLIQKDNKFQIVSGAGSKSNPVALGHGALFASGNQGFSKLEFHDDNSVWISFYEAEKDGKPDREVFRHKLFVKETIYPQEEEYDFTEFESGERTKVTAIYDSKREKSGFYNAVFGKHYRTLYSEPIEVPMLDVSTYKGGLKPLKRGGGYQTNSLRMEDNEGRHWVLRALRKDPTRLLPSAFRETFAYEFMDDQFNTAHPYAAFGIAPMAEAIGIFHTRPALYYVPKQPGLGKFNEFFGGELYLVEERPDGDRSDLPNLGRSEDIVSSGDLIENIRKNHKHKPNGEAVARARLFDILIGDWDRHEDQWRWATFEEGNKTVYYPIPRDRDQAFVKWDGLAYSILNKTLPVYRQWQKFDHEIQNVPGINFNGKYVDRSFMTEVDWPAMEAQAKHIQEKLTDDIIRKSIAQWPERIFKINGEEIIAKLKSRRDDLHKYAREYYLFLSKSVDVVGTDDRDLFEVERLVGGKVNVQVFELSKKGNKKDLFYERTFVSDETKEIVLYGLRDDDVFEIKGNSDQSILVRAVGGLGKDEFKDHSTVSGAKKKTIFYDDQRKNEFDPGTEAKVVQSSRRKVNLYDRKEFSPNYAFPFPFFSFNSDDGLLVGGFYQSVKHGFKKEPYKSAQSFGAFFSPTTGGYDINYKGDFISLFGEWDLLMKAEFHGLQTVRNFYGFGNDTEELENVEGDFYRVRNSLARIHPSFKKRLGKSAKFMLGPFFENINVESTADRFIVSEEAAIPDKAFSSTNFGGFGLAFEFQNLDIPHNPTRGAKFHLRSDYTLNLSDSDRSFLSLNTALSFYQSLIGGRRLVWAQRVGYGHNFGNEFDFFHAQTLGSANIRGISAQRFSGKRVFYHNTDLRLKIGEMKSYVLPNHFGISAGLDGGKVWVPELESEKWHLTYGGGIWFSPFDMFTLSAGYYLTNTDDAQLSILMNMYF